MQSEQNVTVVDLETLVGPFETSTASTLVEVSDGVGPEPDSLRIKVHQPGAIEIGLLVGFDAWGVPLVAGPFDQRDGPWPARSLVALGTSDLGREVALSFEGGDPGKPLVIGLVQEPRPGSAGPEPAAAPAPVEVEIDGEKLVLTAGRELVLRCGQASLILTRAGKILIRGTYVLNRSTGVNRIQGGVVHIN